MGKPVRFAGHPDILVGKRTRGSKTFQYPEEKKTMLRKQQYFLSSGERKGRSSNRAPYRGKMQLK